MMNRKLIISSMMLIFLATTQTFAAPAPIQRIDVVNMLWNTNATNAVPGLTPTAVVVAFKNGGTTPCYTTTLPFQGATIVLSGPGQVCVAAVTSVGVTPVAGPAGTVYAIPSDIPINSAYFASQLIINDKTDPVFDTSNGAVTTQGTLQVAYQGQLR